MKIIGIESSCDETGVAVYDTALSGSAALRAHSVYSQVALHAEYGGVVPELASRDHVRKLLPLLRQTLAEAKLSVEELDGVAYTAGPGLVGALLVGAGLHVHWLGHLRCRRLGCITWKVICCHRCWRMIHLRCRLWLCWSRVGIPSWLQSMRLVITGCLVKRWTMRLAGV